MKKYRMIQTNRLANSKEEAIIQLEIIYNAIMAFSEIGFIENARQMDEKSVERHAQLFCIYKEGKEATTIELKKEFIGFDIEEVESEE